MKITSIIIETVHTGISTKINGNNIKNKGHPN